MACSNTTWLADGWSRPRRWSAKPIPYGTLHIYCIGGPEVGW